MKTGASVWGTAETAADGVDTAAGGNGASSGEYSEVAVDPRLSDISPHLVRVPLERHFAEGSLDLFPVGGLGDAEAFIQLGVLLGCHRHDHQQHGADGETHEGWRNDEGTDNGVRRSERESRKVQREGGHQPQGEHEEERCARVTVFGSDITARENAVRSGKMLRGGTERARLQCW